MKRQHLFLIAILFLTIGSLNAQQYNGFTFYSPTSGSTAYLVDTNGTVVHTWNCPSTARTGYSSYMLPGGSIIRTISNSGNTFSGGGVTGALQKTDWNGNTLWTYVYSTTTYCMHHDICPMPNGNVLLISYESKTASEVTQAGCSQALTMWPEKIVEIQQTGPTTGTVVWEWHVWDHLVQNHDAAKDNYQASIIDHPELLNINYQTSKDWMHMNGIDYNEQLNQIVVSSHNLDQFFVIDHSTTTAEAASHAGGNSGKGGDFLYRWGNPDSYDATGTTDFNVIHDAHFIPQDCPHAGYIAGFNNNGISNNQSCIDMVNPPYDGYNYLHTTGTAYTPTTYDYRHACNGHTGNMGNSQELPNGNMLVCIAQSGSIYEIDSAQNVLWTKNVNGTVPQAFRYSPCYTSGTPPTTPSITQSGDTLTSTVGVTYAWYFNGSPIPATNDIIYVPANDGDYSVQVIDSNGCASAISAAVNYNTTGISESKKNSIGIFPNPSTGIINISGLKSELANSEVIVTDLQGKIVLETKIKDKIDLSRFENGIYYVTVKSGNTELIRNRIVLIK